MRKSISSLILFVFSKVQSLFVALYAKISVLFTSTAVFLPNYSSENVKTNSIRPVSACLAFFEAIWYFFTSGLAFFVHLDLAPLAGTCNLQHLHDCWRTICS